MIDLILGVTQVIASPEVIKTFIRYGLPAGIIVLGWAFNTRYLKVVFINRFEKLENLVTLSTEITEKIGKLTEFKERLQGVYQNSLKQVNEDKLKKIFNYGYERTVAFANNFSYSNFTDITPGKVNASIDYEIDEARKKTLDIFCNNLDFVGHSFEMVYAVPANRYRDKILEILEDNFNDKACKFERCTISFMEDTFSLFSKYWNNYLIEQAQKK